MVALMLGREYTGIELRQEQVDENYKNAGEMGVNPTWYCDDSLNIDQYIDATPHQYCVEEALKIAGWALATSIGEPKPLTPCQRYVVEKRTEERREYPVTHKVIVETRYFCPLMRRAAVASCTLETIASAEIIEAYEREGALNSICAECKYRQEGAKAK